MPWDETTRTMQRARFLREFDSCLYTMSELCARYGISRKTGYKWAQRFAEEGFSGLEDQSRRARSCPHRTPAEVEAELVELRQKHADWGPRKLLIWLRERRPEVAWPAASTVGDVLRRHGLLTPGVSARPRGLPTVHKLTQAATPNEVWTSDFKGQFRTGDRRFCYPLTVADAYSRFLLGVEGLDSVREARAWPVFERLFRQYGLPAAIRTDNGSPFASTSVGRLSRLSVRWLKLGIRLERIAPGHPEQNGSHERMHRTLKEVTARPPAANARAQQARFEEFRRVYNEERPHEALGQQPPARRYHRSPRPYPEPMPEPEYPGYFEVRSVSATGTIKWRGEFLFVSEALAGERIGLEETADGQWAVYFGQVRLARFDEQERKLYG